jgi:hypothetical protein
MGLPSRLIETWKTWELGAPHLGVEITSDSDAPRLRFEEKLERYRHAGVLEVVRFDAKDQTTPSACSIGSTVTWSNATTPIRKACAATCWGCTGASGRITSSVRRFGCPAILVVAISC